jgi:hypothetical protein
MKEITYQPNLLNLDILQQPDEMTCGPTALHSVYRYFGDHISLDEVIRDVHQFEDGGTLAVWLGSHALKRGYEATLYSCNLQLLDPTWFCLPYTNLIQKLKDQLKVKKDDDKIPRTTEAFIEFLSHGGIVKMEDFSRDLLRKVLNQNIPILTGLSSTFLYRSAREAPPNQSYDDLRGIPVGHFVILCGYDRESKLVQIADPHAQNPYSRSRKYQVHIDRVLCSILLGVLTYDANFLVIRPKKKI